MWNHDGEKWFFKSRGRMSIVYMFFFFFFFNFSQAFTDVPRACSFNEGPPNWSRECFTAIAGYTITALTHESELLRRNKVLVTITWHARAWWKILLRNSLRTSQFQDEPPDMRLAFTKNDRGIYKSPGFAELFDSPLLPLHLNLQFKVQNLPGRSKERI